MDSKQAFQEHAEHFAKQIADIYPQLVDEEYADMCHQHPSHPLTREDVCQAIDLASSVVDTAVKSVVQPSGSTMHPQTHARDVLECAAHAFAEQIHTRFGISPVMDRQATNTVSDAVAFHAQRVWRDYSRRCNLEAAVRLRAKTELVSKGHLKDLLKEHAEDFAQQITGIYPQLVDEEWADVRHQHPSHPLTDKDVCQAIESCSVVNFLLVPFTNILYPSFLFTV
jgi:hypothetical protein